MGCAGYLRATATLHHTLVLWHIATEPLLLASIPIPALFERVEIELHNLR
jgi:hypothetical protein